MCQHEHTETSEYIRPYLGEGGIEFEEISLTLCLDCGEYIDGEETVLAVDPEPTIFEIENHLVPVEEL